MIVDIGAHLRQLVLAGLPVVLGAACDTPPGQRPLPAALAATCEPRMIFELPPPMGARTTAIGFDRNDPRVSDLYEACVGTGDYCTRLCQEVLLASNVPVPGGQALSPPHRCELACDSQGQPVVTVAYTSVSVGVPGRRPQGFSAGLATEPGTTLGEFFAACAALEGASIAAFDTLAAELEHHGAPRALAVRARIAAREEARHFQLTARLARRFGAPPVRCPRLPARPARALSVLALENATEGCVNETFSAALTLWQASTASEREVRADLSRIAVDELSHAQLAWDVDAWACDRLGPRGAAELRQARAEASLELRRACARPVDADLVARAGLPDSAASTWLASQAQPLWS